MRKQNKSLGGRSKGTVKLTYKLINKLQKYYDLAIMSHQGNVDEMYKAIWATFVHSSSTDTSPNHGNCLEGGETWYAYRRAEAEGLDVPQFKHD